MNKMEKARKILSMLMAAMMFAALLPPMAFAESSSEADDKIVKIKVTATQADENGDAILDEDGEEVIVTVPGATVGMFGPDDIYESKTTGEDGYAEFDLSGYSDDVISQITFSASKVVASGSGIGDGEDGGNRDALFSMYGEDRLQLELHSESIDSNGNWYGKNYRRDLPTKLMLHLLWT